MSQFDCPRRVTDISYRDAVDSMWIEGAMRGWWGWSSAISYRISFPRKLLPITQTSHHQWLDIYTRLV